MKFFQRISEQGLVQVLNKVIGYIFGSIISIRLDRFSKICVRGKIKIIKRNGDITIGDFTTLWPRVKLSCVGRSKIKRSKIQIGKRCSIGDRTEIHAGEKVSIGNDVIIAWDCVIMDRDYHSYGNKEIMRPVVIKDKVWIGCRSIILKGVEIGENSIVGAGSVVTKNILSGTIVAGNPAKKIKKIKEWKV